MGKLEINVIPVDVDGESEVPDDMIPDDPTDLIGQRMDFIVQISKAIELPPDFCQDVYCEYTFFLGEEKFTTETVPGKNRNPVFDFKFHHTIDPCTEFFLQYLQKDSLCIKLYGFPDFKALEEKPQTKKQDQKKKKSLMSSTINSSMDKSKSSNSTADNSFSNNSFEKQALSKTRIDSNHISKEFNVVTDYKVVQPQEEKYDNRGNNYSQPQQRQQPAGKGVPSGTMSKKKKDQQEDCTIF